MHPPSLKARALQLLARREHGRAELERKLAPHAEDAEEIRRVLDELQDKGYLDDRRFADSCVHRRGARLGPARLQQELRDKGLTADAIAETLAPLRTLEPEHARAVWERRFGRAPQDAAERARQMRFLAARGFSAEIIRKVVPKASGEHDVE